MNIENIKNFTTKYIENKLEENNRYIRCTFYEIRVKDNLSEEETNEFIKLARTYLENKNFNVYLTETKFIYKNANRTVQPNELFIAFKE